MDNYIYKILTHDQFKEMQDQGRFSGSALDVKDGYIHCSTEEQVQAVREKFFKDQDTLILLTISPKGLDVRFEVSPRSKQCYPHIYENLPIANVIASKKIA
ncbi:MAG: DUF952 domain-containing protein [Alphaproteobacteria bacterium]|nr:DUF952 domain-containing protein [Alphaproteobacteria bacterium]